MKQLGYILGSLMVGCLLGVAVAHLTINKVIDNFFPDEAYFEVVSK